MLRKIDTLKTISDVPYIYISMDTKEGADCAGHWIYECAFFLPYIKDIQKELIKPVKILLCNKKQYKTNILHDFGFEETDIEYSTQMLSDGDSWQQQYVSPTDPEHIMYVPTFFYVWNTTIHTTPFFNALHRFRDHYIVPLGSIRKTIPILYLQRSKKENYKNNFRSFVNMEAFCNMMHKTGVVVLDVDACTSFQQQFDIVSKSRVLFLEMGSVFSINAAFIASNSHIVIINDLWGYYTSETPFFHIFRKLMKERNNTVEIFSQGAGNTAFNVDVHMCESLIETIQLKRNVCVICQHTEFETINSFPGFPIMAISNDAAPVELYDYTLIACKNCNCPQLQNLVNPSTLYSDVYMNATFSPSWEDHHTEFSKFILMNTEEVKLLEVGANKGDLYKIMTKERAIEFATLDMWKHPDLPSEIKFIEGNCETFDFSGHNSIILSHVFEHLYTPLKFIENIRNSGVASVFISIPNFEYLLMEQSTTTIHSQHTFYCGFDYIIYMFSLHNYKCDAYFLYNGNFKSMMFKFVLDYTFPQKTTPSINPQAIKDIYVDKINRMSNVEIPTISYIAPAGVYGQYFYYFLKNKENIIGFLDNNAQRHNKKLYGTDKLVYSPLHIDYSNATIIVCECPYKEEIVAGFRRICPDVKIINV